MSKAKEVITSIEENSKVKKMARDMVGDGKTPNKYFLSISNDYDVLEGSEIYGADEVLKKFKSQGKMIDVYDSYSTAKAEADSFVLGKKSNGVLVRRVTIEDRISGVVYERVKLLNLTTIESSEDEREDIGFTMDKLGDEFQ